MKKILFLFLIPFLFYPSISARGNGRVQLDLFFECMDSGGWQWFFVADAIREREKDVSLNVYCIVSKDDKGKWKSPRGKVEVDESKRVAVAFKYYRKKALYYLNGRSLSPWRDGWIDAAIFAQINPDVFKKRITEDGDSALEKHYEKARELGVKEKTLFINGVKYEGEMNLSDLMKTVNRYLAPRSKFKLYTDRKNVAVIPEFIVLVDNKFALKNDAVINSFKRYFSRIKPQIVDYTTNKIFKARFIPAYLIENNKETRDAFSPLIKAGVFEKYGKYFVYYDKGSQGVFTERKEEKGKLEVFAMSQCPFGTQAEDALIDAYEKKLLPKNTRIQFHYILDAKKTKGGYEFQSLHGKEEWQENARQIYIALNHPDKFFAYLKERNKNFRSSDWEKAAKKAGISVKEIKKNFERAKELLYEDAQYASSLEITASPTFLVGGKYLIVGLGRLKNFKGYEKIPAEAAQGACK